MNSCRFGALHTLGTYRIMSPQSSEPTEARPFTADHPLLNTLQPPHTEDVLAFSSNGQVYLIDDRPDNIGDKGHKSRFLQQLAEFHEFMDNLRLNPEHRPRMVEVFKQYFVDRIHYIAIKPIHAQVEVDETQRPVRIGFEPEEGPPFTVSLSGKS